MPGKASTKLLMIRCRVLENQVRAVEESRDRWRQKCLDREALKKVKR